MATISVTSIRKSFGNLKAVEDVSFEVNAGEIFGLLGPNGAGKTTTLRMLMDIFKPDGGQISLLGGPLDQAKKRRIGYMPEERGLYKDLELDRNLVFLATLKGLSEGDARRRLTGWLERMDLSAHRSKKVQELSKGMQQKAQLIATLLHDPDLIVIDEPFSGLDPVNTRLVKDIIEEQRLAGKTILMSTHQMNQVEALCNRIVLIHHGRSVLYGEVGQIKRDFAPNAVRLKGQGDFSQTPGVLQARRDNGAWQMTLQQGVNPQDVLRALALRRDLIVERFEIAEPSLDDIFISIVRQDPDETEAGHA